MTTLSGIKDAQYLAQFLGGKIAIKASNPKRYKVYPILYSISADREVQVVDSQDILYTFLWEDCENPYVVMMDGIELEMK